MRDTVYEGNKLIGTNVEEHDVIDLIWDWERNTKEHPIRVFDENGKEVEW